MIPPRLEDTRFWVIARRSSTAREFAFGWARLRTIAVEIAHAALGIGLRGVHVIDRLASPEEPWHVWPADGTKRDR